MEDISALTALGAGFVSFLSPCVLPLVPIYLAGLAGPEILEAKTDKKSSFGGRGRDWPDLPSAPTCTLFAVSPASC